MHTHNSFDGFSPSLREHRLLFVDAPGERPMTPAEVKGLHEQVMKGISEYPEAVRKEAEAQLKGIIDYQAKTRKELQDFIQKGASEIFRILGDPPHGMAAKARVEFIRKIFEGRVDVVAVGPADAPTGLMVTLRSREAPSASGEMNEKRQKELVAAANKSLEAGVKAAFDRVHASGIPSPTLANLSASEKNVITGRVMFSHGVTVQEKGDGSGFEAVAPSTNLEYWINRLMGAITWYRSVRSQFDAKVKQVTEAGSTPSEEVPASLIALERNSGEAAQAFSQRRGENLLSTATLSAGRTRTETTESVLGVNTKVYKFSMPMGQADGGTAIGADFACVNGIWKWRGVCSDGPRNWFDMTERWPAIVAATVEPARTQQANRVFTNRMATLLGQVTTEFQKEQKNEAEEKAKKDSAEKLRKNARNAVNAIDALVKVYNTDCALGEGGRALAFAGQIDAKKTEINELIGPVGSGRILTPEQQAQASALLGELATLAERVRTEFKNVKAEKNARQRLQHGTALVVASTFAGGITAGNITNDGGNQWYVDLTGAWNFRVRWNESRKTWQTAIVDEYGSTVEESGARTGVWHDVDRGPWEVSQLAMNGRGRRQANNCIEALMKMQAGLPVDPSSITIPG